MTFLQRSLFTRRHSGIADDLFCQLQIKIPKRQTQHYTEDIDHAGFISVGTDTNKEATSNVLSFALVPTKKKEKP